jgi:predicted RNA-binding Zn-ribbon protein involved in translation (DUF1610 family)
MSDSLGEMLARNIVVRDTRPTVEWLLEYSQTYPPLAIHGPLDVSKSRNLIGPFDALDDERTREVNVLAPPRSGKSLVGDGWQHCVVYRRPGPFLAVHQTDPDAKLMHDGRFMKMLRGCELTAPLEPRGKYKWEEFEMNNGVWLYTGGPSLSNLSSKPAQYIRQEEVWMWPQGRVGEADARAGDYIKMESSKILRSSQGGPPEGRALKDSEWAARCNRATPHEWEVACMSCGKFFDPVFSGTRPDGTFWGVTWDHHKTSSGDWDLAKCLPTVRFECPHCGQPCADTRRVKSEWNRTGRYRFDPTADRRRVLFHFESVIDFPWDELVGLWLDACNAFARGNIQPKLQFYQKRRAKNMDEASLLRGGMNFKRTPYEISSEWPDEVARFVTVDRQEEDLYWWTVRAWSPTRSRRLGFGKCFGESGIKEIQAQYKIPKENPHWVLIDSGYLPKGDRGVYAMCCRNGWLAIKGDKQYEFFHTLADNTRVRRSYAELSYGDPESGTMHEGRRFAPLIRFSKAQMNQKVQELIDSGRWEEPVTSGTKEMEEEYNEQMSSRVRLYDATTKTVTWHEGPNDHARDNANGQVLAAILLGIVGDPATEETSASDRKEAA